MAFLATTMNENANRSPGITDILANNNCTVPVKQLKMNLTIPFSSKETAKDPQCSTVIISHLVNSTIQDIQVSCGNERMRSVLCKVGDLTASV